MTYIKLNAVDDGDARAELIEEIVERYYEDVPIIGKTDQNYLVMGVVFIDGNNEMVFHHENTEDFGNIVEWAFCENPTEVQETDKIGEILDWFKTAKPHPTEKDKATQIGAHFEEVAEMMESLGVGTEFVTSTEIVSEFFYRADQILENDDGLAEDWRGQLLDSLCDQIVTAVGVAHMMGMDINGALAEVIRSNNSKFVDGKAVKNEHGKIMKGENYSPPNLKPFL